MDSTSSRTDLSKEDLKREMSWGIARVSVPISMELWRSGRCVGVLVRSRRVRVRVRVIRAREERRIGEDSATVKEIEESGGIWDFLYFRCSCHD